MLNDDNAHRAMSLYGSARTYLSPGCALIKPHSRFRADLGGGYMYASRLNILEDRCAFYASCGCGTTVCFLERKVSFQDVFFNEEKNTHAVVQNAVENANSHLVFSVQGFPSIVTTNS